MRHEREPLGHGLGEHDAVEGVAVDGLGGGGVNRFKCENVRPPYRQQLKAEIGFRV